MQVMFSMIMLSLTLQKPVNMALQDVDWIFSRIIYIREALCLGFIISLTAFQFQLSFLLQKSWTSSELAELLFQCSFHGLLTK